MKDQLNSVKNFVVRNQTRILVATTVVSTTFAAIELRANLQHNKFLKEKNLFDEYYTIDEDN